LVCVIIKRKSAVNVLALGLIVVLLVVALSFTQGATMMLGKSIIKAMPITSVETTENQVALAINFSDKDEYLDTILDTLQDNDTPATVFVLGNWGVDNTDALDTLKTCENIEIGALGYSTPNLANLKKGDMQNEISNAVSILSDATNQSIDLLSTAGGYNKTLLDTANQLGLKPVGTMIDNSGLNTKSQIVGNMLRHAEKGSIISIDGSDSMTVSALAVLLVGLKNKGLKVVSVGSLFDKGCSCCC